MQRYLISSMLVLTGLIVSASAFKANDQFAELKATRGATQRSMRLLANIASDLTAEARTVGVDPGRLDMSIRLRIMLIGAFGVIVMASGFAVPIVFHKGKPPQCP